MMAERILCVLFGPGDSPKSCSINQVGERLNAVLHISIILAKYFADGFSDARHDVRARA
jgi:hypothetical protein